jgi:hypothetical protein
MKKKLGKFICKAGLKKSALFFSSKEKKVYERFVF